MNAGPDALGGHIDNSWILPQSIQESGPGSNQLNRLSRWPHVDEGVTIPWPDATELEELKTEFFQRSQGDPLGPQSKRWEQKAWAWAAALREKHFGKTKRVTGLWSQAAKRWDKRLSRMEDKDQTKLLMHEVRHGVPLPFGQKPPGRIWTLHNHRNLSERKQHVYNALIEQLDEGSLEGFDVTGGRRPKGLITDRTKLF